LSGPKFEQNVLHILLRFQNYRIALIVMIAVSKDDRNSLRFLWIDDVEKPHPEDEIQQDSFQSVCKSVPS